MKICVLCGGRSNERDVSLSTGAMVAQALRRNGHMVALIDVCEGIELGELTPYELYVRAMPIEKTVISDKAPDTSRFFRRKEGYFGKNVLAVCREADIVFNALHGDEGENGKIQAVFDLLGIRYTGSGMEGCLLAMNKSLSKQLFNENGIPTPASISLSGDMINNPPMEGIDFPCVVKPGSLGSSVGVSIVHDETELRAALHEAERFENLIIIEKYIQGREFSVGVLGGKSLPAIEIVPKRGFYDYKNKYQAGCTEEICPADITEELAEELSLTAEKVYRVLNLNAYARVDFMMDDTGIYCLEANTLPGMTPLSLLPQEAKAAGIEFCTLLELIIKYSMNFENNNIN